LNAGNVGAIVVSADLGVCLGLSVRQYGPSEWRRHRSVSRYSRHLSSMFSSSVVKGLLFPVGVCTFGALAVCLTNDYAVRTSQPLFFSTSCISYRSASVRKKHHFSDQFLLIRSRRRSGCPRPSPFRCSPSPFPPLRCPFCWCSAPTLPKVAGGRLVRLVVSANPLLR